MTVDRTRRVRNAARAFLNVFAALTVAAAANGAPLAPPTKERLAEIDAFVTAEMQRQKLPGLAVAIVGNDDVWLSRGYGLANVEHDVAVTPATIFQSGSVGKQFTTVAVMLQAEEGRLSLDDPIAKFFDGAPASWQRITVRHLLTHTSGIPDYTGETSADLGVATGIDFRRDYTEQELVQIAFNLPLSFEPGARWSYSNTGYLVLGAIVRKVSGEFYGDVLAKRVFAPLGMKTARVISEEEIVPNRAAGYRLVEGQLRNQEWYAPTVNTTADGALYLSVADLAAWDRGLRAGALLTKQSWAQVYTPAKLDGAKRYAYGFGWFIGESNGGPWYYHSGSSQGFTTYISRYRAHDLTIVVLTNLIDAEPARFVDGIAAIVDPTLAKLQDRKELSEEGE